MRAILFFFFLLLGATGYAQGTFVKVFEGKAINEGYFVSETPDGGYILCGKTGNSPAGFILKLDAEGDEEWYKEISLTNDIGTSTFTTITKILLLPGGGYIASGSQYINNNTRSHSFFIRLDAGGNITWLKELGNGSGTDSKYIYQSLLTAENDILACGFTNSTGQGVNDIFIVKLSLSGEVLWQKAYGGPANEWAGAILEMNSEYWFSITSSSVDVGQNDGGILRTDKEGVQLDSKMYGTADNQGLSSIVKNVDGTLSCGGLHNNNSASVVTIDQQLNPIKALEYNLNSKSMRVNIASADDSGYIAVLQDDLPTPVDAMLMRTNREGNIVWAKSYNIAVPTKREYFRHVIKTSDGGYLATGMTASGGKEYAYLVKTDAQGNITCCNNRINITDLNIAIKDITYQVTPAMWTTSVPDFKLTDYPYSIAKQVRSFDLCSSPNPPCVDCSSPDAINEGLVFCLPFNGNAADESGNGYNGNANGAVLTIDRFGKENSAFSFDGSNDHLDLAKNLSDLQQLTLSAWIKPRGNIATNGYIFFEGNAECGNDIFLYYKNQEIYVGANKNNAQLNGTAGTGLIPVIGDIKDKWTHIAWTMSALQTKVYINGNLSATIDLGGSGSGYHHTPSIGSHWDGNTAPCGSQRSGFFSGDIDDVRLYNRVLAPSEISTLFRSCDTLVTAVTICSGDSALIYGTYRRQPGLYSSTVPTNTAGCDSTVYTRLSVAAANSVSQNIAICPGDSVYLFGSYRKIPGTYLDTLTSASNCDTVITSVLSHYPVYNTQQNIAICQGDSILIGSVYRKTPGTYTGLYYTANGCDSIIIYNLAVNARTSNQINKQDTTMCDPAGTFDLFSLLKPPYSLNNYRWSGLNGSTVPINNSLITTDSLAGGNYRFAFAAQNPASCTTDTAVVNLNIFRSSSQLIIGPDTAICPGSTYQLSVNFPFTSVLWNTGSTLPSIVVDKPGTYYVTTTVGPCTLQDQMDLYLRPAPQVVIEKQHICPGDSAYVNASCQGCNYLWNDADTRPERWIKPNNPLTVNVTDKHGCVYETEVLIDTDNSCVDDIYAPNSFTPEGDGINDVFRIAYGNVKIVTVSVFNRWGEVIFETRHAEDGWDGTYNNLPVNQGIYIYRVFYIDQYGQPRENAGRVNLMR